MRLLARHFREFVGVIVVVVVVVVVVVERHVSVRRMNEATEVLCKNGNEITETGRWKGPRSSEL